MNIGIAARISMLPAKTIRYYEDINLVIPDRLDNGYRDYADTHIHKLQFVRRSRNLGFSIDECRLLLSLYEDQHRTSAEVKEIASGKLAEINTKIEELVGLKETLSTLIDSCHGDERADCPILNDLAQDQL